MNKRYVLVDGNALTHAAWHGYPEQIGGDGLSYRALHGFLSKMHRLDRSYQWDDMLVVFDPAEGSLYRKALFPGYKAHRPEPEPDLVRQMLVIQDVLCDLGFSTMKVPGVESDDVIGTLAKHWSKEAGSIVMIVTPDKDMAQLVNSSVGLLRPLRGEAAIEVPFDYLSSEGIVEKFGVQPNQIASWLALIGDVSDNIPGVPGVGPKTATKLLEKYGDLMTIMTHADSVPGKLGESLRESRGHIETSHKLTTIQTDLPMHDWVHKRGTFDQAKRDMWAELALFPHWMGYYEFNAALAGNAMKPDVGIPENPF